AGGPGSRPSSAEILSMWLWSSRVRSSHRASQASYSSRDLKILLFFFAIVVLEKIRKDGPNHRPDFCKGCHDGNDLAPVDALFFLHAGTVSRCRRRGKTAKTAGAARAAGYPRVCLIRAI